MMGVVASSTTIIPNGAAQDSDGALVVRPSTSNNNDTTSEQSTTSDLERCRFAQQLSDYRPTDVSVQTVHLRPYQQELCEPVLAGHNVVLTAPTGTGKTIVAAHCIRQHFVKNNDTKELRRVMFLVPTVPLVDQQTRVLYSLLHDICEVQGLAGGETSTPKLPKVLGSHVTVCTPQILVNMLINEIDTPLRWDDFTMLLIDECHHTKKGHPYNMIMDDYANTKHTCADVKLPQVVGMTASLGTGQSRDLQSATHHVLRTAARLCATRLGMVQRELDSLNRFANDPFDEFIQCQQTFAKHPYYTMLCDVMRSIEQRIKPTLDALVKNNTLQQPKSTKKQLRLNVIPMQQYSQRYEQWRQTLQTDYVPKLRDTAVKLKLMRCLDYLKIFGHALELLAHLPAQYAHQYVNEQLAALERSERTQVNEMDHNIQRMYATQVNQIEWKQNEMQDNELVMKLVGELQREFNQSDASTRRAIVFVRTRAMTRFLRDYLNSGGAQHTNTAANGGPNDNVLLPAGVRVGSLTSANQSADKFGQGKEEQEQTLERFRRGQLQVLIATSVAEEGLDIPQCTLIVTYNLVSNDIARQQKKGRARRQDSRSVLLAQDGWLADREINNMRHALLLQATLQHLYSLGVIAVQKRIEQHMTELQQQREMESEKCIRQRQELSGKVYTLGCRHCSRLLCASTSIRLIAGQHYVITDPSIWDRCALLPLSRVRVFDGCAVVARLCCEKCRHQWGNVTKLGGVFLPNLEPAGFQVFDSDGRPLDNKSKWSSITEHYFNVNTITKQEKQIMKEAMEKLIESDQSTFDEIAKRIEEEEMNLQQREREAQQQEDDFGGEIDVVNQEFIRAKLLEDP